MSTNRISPKAGYVFPSTLPKGPQGRALCRNCGTEVPKGRRTFCGQPCIDDWSVRTNPEVMRRLVFDRDRGVCRRCGADTESLRKELAALPPDERRRRRRHLRIPESRHHLWDADHIVAVVEGGGECGIDNIQTLCLDCHKHKTAELARKRKIDRARERQIDRAVQAAMRLEQTG